MKFTSILQKVSKRTWAVVAMATAVVAVPAGLLAWGPDRPTYTMAHPADHVTFNSITDATNYGDERNFVTISEDGKTYKDDITVQNGKEYTVRIYVHNNAASNLKLVAENVITKLNVPTQTASRIQIDGYVNSSNAKPTSVWDQAVFHGANDSPFKLDFVNGSAYYKNAKGQFTLGDSITGSGVKLGYTKMDGKIPGCFEYSGVVYLKVKASTADFSINKTVRKTGTTTFTESVTVAPGDKVDYQLYFKNTGGIRQTTVSIKDVLPAGVTYVPGTTYVHDDQGTRQVPDGIATGGMTMGNFAPNGDVYIKFTGQVAANDKLEKCGTNTLINTMKATTAESGTKTDTATVIVPKTCEPEKVTACNLDTKKIEQNVDKSKIDNIHYTLDLEKCKEVEKVKACNLDTMKIEENVDKTKIDNVHYTLDLTKCEKKPELVTACNLDTKKIEQNVDKSKIDNIHYTLDLEKCKTVVDKDIQVCRLSDNKYPVTIKESEFDSSKYSKDPADCKTEDKDIVVCRLSDKTYPVTIKESEFDSSKYSKDAADCKTTETPMCEVPGKEHLPADSEDCVEEETPEELPHTGMGETLLSVLGAGSLASAAGAYIASRRK